MATQQTIATLTGTVQKYMEDSWQEMPELDFRTPLANSSVLEKATIPANSGTYAEFRTFDHFAIEASSASNDTPKTYAENAEPADSIAIGTNVKQLSFEIIADYAYLGNVQIATDKVDLMRKMKEEFSILIRRKIHKLTNDRFVRPITANVLNSATSPTPLPTPLKTIFGSKAQGFADLTADSVITPNDIKRAVSALRNSNVPGVYGDKYACFIDNALWMQLQEDDEFKDQVKRVEDMNRKVFQDGGMIDWGGVRFIMQDDPYRAALPIAAVTNVLTLRKDTGKVHVCHILGKNCAGYVDFGKPGTVERRTMTPKFKVQDISATGTGPTIGWRMAFQACVLDSLRGINIAATSRFDESMSDL